MSSLLVRELLVSRDQGQDKACSLPSIKEYEGTRGENESKRWERTAGSGHWPFPTGLCPRIWSNPWLWPLFHPLPPWYPYYPYLDLHFPSWALGLGWGILPAKRLLYTNIGATERTRFIFEYAYQVICIPAICERWLPAQNFIQIYIVK